MSDIHIRRDHQLGLAGARALVRQWTGHAEKKFALQCTLVPGKASDTVEFTRSGMSGQVIVAADHFELNAKLGFLLGAFSKTIAGEIEKSIDELLAQAPPAAKKAARKVAKK